MRVAVVILIFGGLSLTTLGQEAEDGRSRFEILPRPVVSKSGQFYVYANDLAWSVKCVQMLERIRSSVRNELKITDAWRDPLLVIARQENVPPDLRGSVQLTARVIEGQQIYFLLYCFAPWDMQKLGAAAIEALSLEFVTRGINADASRNSLPRLPPWWVQGLWESVTDEARDRHERILARAWTDGVPTPATVLLNTTELPADELDRIYFQAQCGVLFRSLTMTDWGKTAARRFLAELFEGRSATESFGRAFGFWFPDEASLEKWWALETVASAKNFRAQFLTMSKTAAALDQLLVFTLNLTEPKSKQTQTLKLSVEQLVPYRSQQDLRLLLQKHIAQLRLLAGNAHPLYSGAIDAYVAALERLHRGNVSDFQKSLRQANEWREALARYQNEMETWMDETEATLSGTDPFEPYRAEMTRAEEWRRQRATVIQNYMDVVEKELAGKRFP